MGLVVLLVFFLCLGSSVCYLLALARRLDADIAAAGQAPASRVRVRATSGYRARYSESAVRRHSQLLIEEVESFLANQATDPR